MRHVRRTAGTFAGISLLAAVLSCGGKTEQGPVDDAGLGIIPCPPGPEQPTFKVTFPVKACREPHDLRVTACRNAVCSSFSYDGSSFQLLELEPHTGVSVSPCEASRRASAEFGVGWESEPRDGDRFRVEIEDTRVGDTLGAVDLTIDYCPPDPPGPCVPDPVAHRRLPDGTCYSEL